MCFGLKWSTQKWPKMSSRELLASLQTQKSFSRTSVFASYWKKSTITQAMVWREKLHSRTEQNFETCRTTYEMIKDTQIYTTMRRTRVELRVVSSSYSPPFSLTSAELLLELWKKYGRRQRGFLRNSAALSGAGRRTTSCTIIIHRRVVNDYFVLSRVFSNSP